MLQSWERDQSMTMTRFPDYWRGWPENPLETLVVRYIAEQATQRQLVETGEVQMAMAIAVDDLAQLGENPNLQVQSSPSIREYLIRFDNQRPPLDDPLVRQAIIHAFDYQTTVDELLGGFGQIPEGYVPTLYRSHDSSLGPETFDLTKAKQMLDASSSPEGVTFSCTYIGNLDIQRQTAELWQAYLSQIGVTLNLNPQPWATMVERSQSPETRDNAGYFAFNYGNLDETFAQWQTLSSNTNAAWGNYGYQNQQIDDLLNQALTTIDDEERTGILHEAQRLAREDAATVNVLIFQDWVVASSAVQGYVYDPGRPTIPPFYSMSLA
jgi:peptide/nickel transport system substrate-binding protein